MATINVASTSASRKGPPLIPLTLVIVSSPESKTQQAERRRNALAAEAARALSFSLVTRGRPRG